MIPSRPYLFRALIDWVIDNGWTPHIVVDATDAETKVPAAFVQDGRITLNVSSSAVRDYHQDDAGLSFSARFAGTAHTVYVPMRAVLAVFARESGQGMLFGAEPGHDAFATAPTRAGGSGGQASPTGAGSSSASARKGLVVVSQDAQRGARPAASTVAGADAEPAKARGRVAGVESGASARAKPARRSTSPRRASARDPATAEGDASVPTAGADAADTSAAPRRAARRQSGAKRRAPEQVTGEAPDARPARPDAPEAHASRHADGSDERSPGPKSGPEQRRSRFRVVK